MAEGFNIIFRDHVAPDSNPNNSLILRTSSIENSLKISSNIFFFRVSKRRQVPKISIDVEKSTTASSARIKSSQRIRKKKRKPLLV